MIATTLLIASVCSPPTYVEDIQPLLERHCIECHQEGEVAPMAFTDYESVAGWSAMMLEVVDSGRMPPWGANPKYGEWANARTLSTSEKELLHDWVAAGTPLGTTERLPVRAQRPAAWRLPKEPDLVFETPGFEVPATGVVEYQYFTVDPGFTQDVWVKAAEIVPGNKTVVHHCGVGIQYPEGGSFKTLFPFESSLCGYVPGGQSEDELMRNAWKLKSAVYVPAGSKLVFQMHYTPNGSKQFDKTKVGLVLAHEDEVETVPVTVAAMSLDLSIAPNSVQTYREKLPVVEQDTSLYLLTAHMHLRGRSFQFVATYPDGRTESLLDVPKYDFGWQEKYLYRNPKVIPAGTILECIATFDNTSANPVNPDPSKTVKWGEQTWDEMLNAYYVTFVPRDEYLATRKH